MTDKQKIEMLKKQLDVAIKVLEYYKNKSVCQKALAQIKAIANSNQS